MSIAAPVVAINLGLPLMPYAKYGIKALVGQYTYLNVETGEVADASEYINYKRSLFRAAKRMAAKPAAGDTGREEAGGSVQPADGQRPNTTNAGEEQAGAAHHDEAG